jgi:hypothetical protein
MYKGLLLSPQCEASVCPATHMSLLILGIVVAFLVAHLEFNEEALHSEERLV